MGFFDELAGKAFESLGLGKGGNSDLLNAVMEMLNNKESGGLSGLVQSFQQKGLGDIVSSWVSTGKNLPISAEQMLNGMGEDKIGEIANKAGISADAASSLLSEVLPGLIDRLTPNGKIPEGNLIDNGLEMLKEKTSP